MRGRRYTLLLSFSDKSLKFEPFGILATCSESHATNNTMHIAPKILLLMLIHCNFFHIPWTYFRNIHCHFKRNITRHTRTNGAHLSQSCLLVILSLQTWRKAMMIFRKLAAALRPPAPRRPASQYRGQPQSRAWRQVRRGVRREKYAQIMGNFSFMATRGLDTLIPFMFKLSRPRPEGMCCMYHGTQSLQPFDVSLTFILTSRQRINRPKTTAMGFITFLNWHFLFSYIYFFRRISSIFVLLT